METQSGPTRPDWTAGAAKWAAVAVLGAASIFAMAWSLAGRAPARPVAGAGRSGVVRASEIQARGPGGAPAAPRAGIDLNTATAAELELLPGVGPTLAARIVQDREANGPFRSVEDLDRVKGIGPGIIAKVRGMARVGPP